MMQKTIKVKLDADNMKTFGVMFTCCNKRQWIPNELDCGDQWDCDICETPIVFRAHSGQWHYVGNRVFE